MTSESFNKVLTRRKINKDCSSIDSDEYTSILDAKDKNFYCYACDKGFETNSKLLSHLKIHVIMPTILIPKLNEYITKKNVLSTESLFKDCSLKIKIKLSEPLQNSVVKVIENNDEKNKQIGTIRVLRADEIKQSCSSHPVNISETNKTIESKSQDIKPIINNTNDKTCDYSVDGLDQFNEFTTENSDELLQKLLNCNDLDSSFRNEVEWQSSNEFISIDRLGFFCTVCHMNFSDNVMLFDHKRLTGHDYHEEMRRPLLSRDVLHSMQFPQRIDYPGSHQGGHLYSSLCEPDSTHSQHSYSHQSNCYSQQSGYSTMQYTMMQPQSRAPPPIYRGLASISQHQQMMQRSVNGRFGPPSTYSSRFYSALQRPGEFMKTRLQKLGNGLESTTSSVIIGQQTSLRPRFLSAAISSPMRPPDLKCLSNQSANSINPSSQTISYQSRLPNSSVHSNKHNSGQLEENLRSAQLSLGLLSTTLQHQMSSASSKHELKQNSTETPIIKKVRLDERISPLPVIKSVIGGAVQLRPEPNTIKSKNSTSPVQLNEQITFSKLTVEPKKNPKEVANILANRGIIVTRNNGKPLETTETNSNYSEKPTTATQEAVQKLQMNNSVSIISKKKTEESALDIDFEMKIKCTYKDCLEFFPSTDLLNRHLVRDHNLLEKLNVASIIPNDINKPDQEVKTSQIKAFKCKVCPALFSSQSGLNDHQAKAHKIFNTPSDELGIPIVDLCNEVTKRKLENLGITSYIPLGNRSSGSMYAFPIVSIRGAPNPTVHNLLGLGSNAVLSLGPIKQISSSNFGENLSK